MSSASANFFLIARADDAANACAANEAIAETIERGIIRNVSVMGCGPALEHAARVLASLPGVCFGLHATLNAEWERPRWRPVLPASRVPSLVQPDGTFFPHPATLHERGFDLGEMEAEVRAQLEAVRQAGFRIRYLDTHMGFDWLPGAEAVLRRIAEGEGLVFDHPSTHPRLPAAAASHSLADRLRAASPGRYVLITHPGKRGGDMDAGFRMPGEPEGKVALARDLERQALCSPEIFRLLEERGILLTTYA